jgi:hypothetical protein
MSIFDDIARPKRRPKMLNSTFSSAKPDPGRVAILNWLSEEELVEQEDEEEHAAPVAAKASR